MLFDVNNEEARYQALTEKQSVMWEGLCTRCGACCGSTTDDPCENLIKDSEGKHGCRIYDTRFGARKTISGKDFQCVPLRWIVHQSWPGDEHCGYKKKKTLV